MKTFLSLSLVVNFITIFLFLKLLTLSSKEILPKQRAMWGSISGGALFLYLLFVLGISIIGVLTKTPVMILSIVFALIPFIAGFFASYETLKRDLIFQIFSFSLSFVLFFVLLFI